MTPNTEQNAETVFGPSRLKSVFVGEHAWCGEKMMLASELEGGVPLSDFFRSGAFGLALDRYAETRGGKDRRAVASMWSLYYFSILTIPYIVARRAEHAVPIRPDDMTIALSEDGLPRGLGLPNYGDWSDLDTGDLLAFMEPLVHGHLAHMVAELKTHGGIAPKLAWNNAAVYIDYAFNTTQREELADGETWASKPLFCRPTLPDGAPNPFNGCLRHEVEGGQTQCRRKVCCLRYLLPGIPGCGELCALPAQRKQ